MGLYRVKAGQKVGQSGQDFTEGETLQLDERTAAEIRDKVEPVDESGTTISTEAASIQETLASARPHERKSLLEMEREKVKARLEALDAAIAKEEAPAPTEPETVPPEPASPEPTEPTDTSSKPQ